MLSTKADPKLLTEDERAVLDVFRGLNISVGTAAEALARATRPDPAAEPEPEPPNVGHKGAFDATEPEASARPLAVKVLRWAREDLGRARERTAEANRMYSEAEAEAKADDPDSDFFEESEIWQLWVDICVWAEGDAEEHLAGLVLTLHGRVESPRDVHVQNLTRVWPPVAMELDHEILTVAPSDDDDPRPTLIVVGDGDHDCDQYGV